MRIKGVGGLFLETVARGSVERRLAAMILAAFTDDVDALPPLPPATEFEAQFRLRLDRIHRLSTSQAAGYSEGQPMMARADGPRGFKSGKNLTQDELELWWPLRFALLEISATKGVKAATYYHDYPRVVNIGIKTFEDIRDRDRFLLSVARRLTRSIDYCLSPIESKLAKLSSLALNPAVNPYKVMAEAGRIFYTVSAADAVRAKDCLLELATQRSDLGETIFLELSSVIRVADPVLYKTMVAPALGEYMACRGLARQSN